MSSTSIGERSLETSRPARSERFTRVCICVALAASTVLAYWNVWQFEFVNFDDPEYVTENPHVRSGLSWANVGWAMTSSFAANWFPLTWLSLMFDATIWGANDAGGFHITNVVLHIANAVLLFLFLANVTGATWRSAVAAALFAVHPLHVESVAWVTERKDVLSTFFGLLCLWSYCRYAIRNSAAWYAASLALFAASLMSKQMFVTLPALLLLLDYWPLGRFRRNDQVGLEGDIAPPVQSAPARRLIVEKLPFAALAVAAAVVVFIVQKKGGAVQSLHLLPLGTRLANAVVVAVLYLVQTAWPAELAVMYPYPPGGISVGAVALCGTVLVLMTAMAIAQRRRFPYLFFGWLWYVVTLLPVIGIVQVGSQRMADRYTYVPHLGLFVALVWLAVDVVPASVRKFVLPLAAVAAVVLFAFVAHRQAGYWANSIALFERCVDATEHNAVAHTNLGVAYASSGRVDEARAEYEAALSIDPYYAHAHSNLGVILRGQGQVPLALEHFQKAVDINENYAMGYCNLAGLLFELKQFKPAEDAYRRALFLAPEDSRILVGLGQLFRETNRRDEALRHLTTACRLAPESFSAHMNLGMVLYELGHFDEGLEHLERAVALDGESAKARQNFAAALYGRGRFAESIQQYRQALRIEPGFAAAEQGLKSALDARKKQLQQYE